MKSKVKESKVNEIYVNTNALKENQIKGKKPLTDLAETVNFLSERLHEFEINRNLKEETINSLHREVSVFHNGFKKDAGTSRQAGIFFFMG